MPIPLTTITVPTPEPYNSSYPHQQQENFFFVLLQIFDQAKQAGDSITLSNADLTEAVQDLAFTGGKIEVPALGITLSKIGKTLSITTI